MPLRQDVQDAFSALGLTPDVDIEEATKVYRRLALQHHPDRNHGDPNATQRFQQISHSWDICQRYYENPDWANRPEGRYYPDDDMDMDLDGEDLFEFYMFMFTETLFNRFNRSSRKQYRNRRFGRPGGPVFFSFDPSSPEFYRPSYSDDSKDHQDRNAARQQKEKEEYERRRRELELEIEREECEAKERAIKEKADMDRQVGAQERAFQAAHSGDSEEVVRLINEYNLDVGAPRHLKAARGLRKQDENSQYETLLHAAACQCDESLFTFLIEKGANPSMLNKQSLNPFHVAIKAGNSKVVRFILERRSVKSFQDYHPSKTTLSGSTPLQLAIESDDPSTIELLVKHATTHDVERCWKQMDMSEDFKEILRTKKGFVPPGEGFEPVQSRGMSKKVQRQQELAQEKEARLAEELKRAEINRQKKEERAAKRAALEKAAREESELRPKKVAERQRQEEIRHVEAEACARELEGVKLRAEEEEEIRHVEAKARARDLEEARLRAEAEEEEEEIRRAEAEARARKLEADRLSAEAEANANAQKLKELQEARERAEVETRDKAVAAEWLRVQKERLEMQRIEQDRIRKAVEERERQRVEQAMRENENRERIEMQRVEIEKQEGLTRHRSSEATAPDMVDVPAGAVSNKKMHGRELPRDQQKERKKAKREGKVTTDAIPQRPVFSASSDPQAKTSGKKAKPTVNVEQMDERQKSKYEQVMKRRAEQSARDKERHRKTMEERKKAQVESPTQSEQSEYVPLTPVSTVDAARAEPVRSMMLEPTLLSLNGTPYVEDIQTCIVPDDLFRGPSYAPIDSEASFVGKAEPVDDAESIHTRKSYHRFSRQHRSRRGAHHS